MASDLMANQREAAVMLAAGSSIDAVAAHLQVTPKTLRAWTRKEAFRAYMAKEQEYRRDMYRTKLESIVDIAVFELARKVEAGDFRAIESVLDRTGFVRGASVDQRISGGETPVIVRLTAEDAEALALASEAEEDGA